MWKKILIICCAGLILTGCGKTGTGDQLRKKGEETMENRSLTPEQEELLCKISVNEERVREGKLFAWQEELLEQYDFGMNYLKEKYPSYSLKITDCLQKSGSAAYTEFVFETEDEPETEYDLYLYADKNKGTYSAEDNFYGRIIQDEYERQLFEALRQNKITCSRTEAQLPYVKGGDFNESMDIGAIIRGEISLPQITTIYFDNNILPDRDYQKIYEQVKKFVEMQKIYGSFYVVVFDSEDGNKELFRETFSETY